MGFSSSGKVVKKIFIGVLVKYIYIYVSVYMNIYVRKEEIFTKAVIEVEDLYQVFMPEDVLLH